MASWKWCSTQQKWKQGEPSSTAKALALGSKGACGQVKVAVQLQSHQKGGGGEGGGAT